MVCVTLIVLLSKIQHYGSVLTVVPHPVCNLASLFFSNIKNNLNKFIQSKISD